MASHSNPLKRSASIKRYSGFEEDAYRYLFAYGDHFEFAPKLSVILATGVVENEKTLVPKPGKGLIAYVYKQTVNPDLVEEYLETPFVREATEDGSRRTLVQAWTINYNETFREQYEIHEVNPNPLIFKETAKLSFEAAMNELFEIAPDDSSAPKVLYCHRASVNNSDVLIGPTEKLIAHLKGNAQDRINLGILTLSADGFVTQMFDKNGAKTDTKPFTMALGEVYVLYKKTTDITMACATEFKQFMDGRKLLKEIPLEDEGVDKIDMGNLPPLMRCFTNGGTAPVGEHPNLPVNPDNKAVLLRVNPFGKPYGKRNLSDAQMSPIPVHDACKLVRTKNSKQCKKVRASLTRAAERNMHVDTGK